MKLSRYTETRSAFIKTAVFYGLLLENDKNFVRTCIETGENAFGFYQNMACYSKSSGRARAHNATFVEEKRISSD